jgi:hypothetical protein
VPPAGAEQRDPDAPDAGRMPEGRRAGSSLEAAFHPTHRDKAAMNGAQIVLFKFG